MHKLYGFDCFKVLFDLNPDNPQFSITKLKTPSKVFELECEKKYEHQRSFKFMENPETGKVEQVTTKMAALHLEQQVKHDVETLVEYELGFSRVIELIIKAKKPFIGHNMFLDQLYLYQ